MDSDGRGANSAPGQSAVNRPRPRGDVPLAAVVRGDILRRNDAASRIATVSRQRAANSQ